MGQIGNLPPIHNRPVISLPHLNWFVGYLERSQRHYLFATNIEAPNITDPLTARRVSEQILHDLKPMGLN